VPGPVGHSRLRRVNQDVLERACAGCVHLVASSEDVVGYHEWFTGHRLDSELNRVAPRLVACGKAARP